MASPISKSMFSLLTYTRGFHRGCSWLTLRRAGYADKTIEALERRGLLVRSPPPIGKDDEDIGGRWYKAKRQQRLRVLG